MSWEGRVGYSVESPSGLIWKTSTNAKNIGKVVGYVRTSKRGIQRWQTMIGGKSYLCHRIIWEIFNGEIEAGLTIDHIDQNPLNNRIENLRCVPNQINARNKGRYQNSSTGVNGICFWFCRNGDEYVAAQWQDLEGNRKGKKFSINKYGRDEAIRLGIEYRNEQIRILNLKGAGYSVMHGLEKQD